MSQRDIVSFGEVLYLRRKAAGLTQASLGALVGLTGESLSQFEKGHREARPVCRYALRHALGLPEDADDGWWRVDW